MSSITTGRNAIHAWDRKPMGFFTDTTLCIGCKACEVACKQWNGLPADGYSLSGYSYDNTLALGSETWRHVAFVEQDDLRDRGTFGWLMLSDVCKHCTNAGCLQACPTGAIVRTEFDTVYVRQDVCNGCGYCVPACPYGVIDLSPHTHTARKCTLCYDRLSGGMEPACAKACPTQSIQFGYVDDLRAGADQRVAALRAAGVDGARLYGVDEGAAKDRDGSGSANAIFLLLDEPQRYNLPARVELPQNATRSSAMLTALTGLALSLGAAWAFGRRAS